MDPEGPSPHPSWLPRVQGWEGPERRGDGLGGHCSSDGRLARTGGRGTDGNSLGGKAGRSWRWHRAGRRVVHHSPLIAGAWPPRELTQSLLVTPPEMGEGCWPRPPLLEPESGMPAGVPGAVVTPLCPAHCLRLCSDALTHVISIRQLSPCPANHSARGAGHKVDEQPGDLSGQERARHSAHGWRVP